jgi:hypothetical protein
MDKQAEKLMPYSRIEWCVGEGIKLVLNENARFNTNKSSLTLLQKQI